MKRSCCRTDRHEFPAPEAIYQSVPDGLWAYCEECAHLYTGGMRMIDPPDDYVCTCTGGPDGTCPECDARLGDLVMGKEKE